jgi:hypothetical protein
MNADLDRLSAVIADGIATAERLLGLSVQAATRQTLDYTPVRAMVIATAERLLALPAGTLTQKGF